jgi:predicted metal-dependent phosphoesterase TrpH
MNAPARIDLHVHSRHSPDSSLRVTEVAELLRSEGFRGFALTDHNSVEGHRELSDLKSRFPRFLLVPGVEVSTREGHLLVYGVPSAPPPHRPIAETVEWVAGQGGVAVLAHPFRRSHGVGRRVAETASVSALEAKNGHTSEVANAKAGLVAARRHLGATGGSDAHSLADLGHAFTEFPPEVESVDDLLEAIRHGWTAAGGRSLGWPGRLRLSLRTGALLIARGFRPI